MSRAVERLAVRLFAGFSLLAFAYTAPVSAGTFGRVIPISGMASDLALDEGRGVIYVANFTARRIEVITLATGVRQQPITVNIQPASIDVSPDRRYLIVGHNAPFEEPLSPRNGITLIDLNDRRQHYISVSAPVYGVAFGSDGIAFAITNKEFLLINPTSAEVTVLDTVGKVALQALPVPVGKAPPEITEASLGISSDRNFIYALAGHNETQTFKYDVRNRVVRPGGIVLASGTLGPRVVSLNFNGSRVFAGWVMVDERGNFSNFFRETTNEFSVGSTAFDDRRNLIYAQMPKTKTEPPTLMITDGDNLAVIERMQLAEDLAGKSILSRDGNTMYSISASGITVFPIGALNTQHRLAFTPEDLVFRGNFCNRLIATQVLTITNPGGGATDFTLKADGPGITFSRTSGTTPATVTVTVDPRVYQNAKGTSVVNVNVTSAGAVNTLRPVRLLINSREPDQRGTIVNVPGTLTDIAADPLRDRFYILRQDKNQVQVYDGTTLRLITTLKTYNSPTSLAVTTDGQHLLVGHDSSQVAAIYELDTLRQLPYISVESGSGNVAHHIAAAENGVYAAATDYQSKGHIIRLDLAGRTAVQLPSLGPFKNDIDTETVAIASADGKSIFFPSANGNVLLYDAASESISVSRKDFEQLSGAYGASNDGTFFVGNRILNNSLVETFAYDDAAGITAGVGFLGGNGYRVVNNAITAPGTLHRLGAGRYQEVLSPVRTIEAAQGSLPGAKFSRTVAPLSNGRTIIVLSVSGFIAIPTDYEASVAIPDIRSIVSAADMKPSIANGGLISLFGSRLASTSIAATGLPAPTVLADSCLTINENPLPLFFVSPGQINAQLPFGPAGETKLVLFTPGGKSAPYTLPVLSSAPAIFPVSLGAAGTTPNVVREANNQVVTLSNPIHRGDAITIYLAGLGSTNPALEAGVAAPTDPIAVVSTKPDVRIGGYPLIVDYAVATPGMAGVYQIRARVPFQVPLGVNMPLEIQQGTGPKAAMGVRVVD